MTKLTMDGRDYVLVAEEVYEQMVERLGGALPAVPQRDRQGHWPAKETILAMMARDVIKQRVAAGWTQEELARRAGVSTETISRLESAKHRPQAATVEKIEQAFKQAGV